VSQTTVEVRPEATVTPSQVEAQVTPEPKRALYDRLLNPMPSGRLLGWLGPILVTILAAALRLPNLSTPKALAFDETYYIKDALSLLLFGYARSTVDGADKIILGSDGNPAALATIFKDNPSFVVHPPVGKWVIAAGENFFGVTPFGWRIGVAVLGILGVLILARVTRRMTRSNVIGTIAGFLLAIDGLGIVMSRTGLLDNTLMFFVLVAFACLLLDRDRTRRRLANRLADSSGLGTAWFGWRPWRLAAGVSLGLACGVKWSGLYYVVAFGLLTVLWDLSTRRMLGSAHPLRAMLLRDALPALASIVGLALLTYIATWAGWLVSSQGWDRQWAVTAGKGDSGLLGLLPTALQSLWHYHVEAWNFHTHLTSPHSYQSNPWGWSLMARPTSFFYDSPTGRCGSATCSQEVISLGNPLIWWAGTLALIHQAWRWIGRRDWRSGAVLCGFVAGWFPWLFFQERTVFTFYAIVYLPFMIIALAMSLGVVMGPRPTGDQSTNNRRLFGSIAVGGFLLAALAATWFFFPIWTAEIITYSQWNFRMWFPTWV